MKNLYSFLLQAILYGLVCYTPTTSIKAQDCFPNGLFLNTQTQVDNFAANNPGCTIIKGGFSISGDNITNLNGLSSIQRVEGDFTISGTFSLTSLEGLSSLEEIGGAVRIQDNERLESLGGLSKLKVIRGEYCYISNNSFVQNFYGFDELDSIIGIVHIFDMPALKNLTGLENLSYLGDRFSVFRNDSLLSLDGLQGLMEVGALDIGDNLQLSDIQALDHPVQINAQLVFTGNPMLTECAVMAICNYFIDPPSFSAFQNNGQGCSNKAELELECTTNGTKEHQVEVIRVYPNPTNDFLLLTTQGIGSLSSVRIINSMGKMITLEINQSRIDVRDLPGGVYFGQFIESGIAYQFKFVKN